MNEQREREREDLSNQCMDACMYKECIQNETHCSGEGVAIEGADCSGEGIIKTKSQIKKSIQKAYLRKENMFHIDIQRAARKGFFIMIIPW